MQGFKAFFLLLLPFPPYFATTKVFFTLDISLAWKGAMFPSVAAVLEFTLVSNTFAFDGKHSSSYLKLFAARCVYFFVRLFLTKASYGYFRDSIIWSVPFTCQKMD